MVTSTPSAAPDALPMPSSEARIGPRKPRQGASFRVCTADDFGLQQRRDNVRKRSGLVTTAACRMCRLRKVKCVESNAIEAGGEGKGACRCQPCQLANLECQWNTVDKRKRRRVNQDQAVRQVETTPAEDESGERFRSREQTSTTSNHREDRSREQVLPQESNTEPPPSQSNTNNFPTLEEQASQPFFAEICPDGTMQMQSPADWTNLGDCVLGLGFMEDANNLDFDAYPSFAFSPSEIHGVPSQEGRPRRVVRVRYYRRFGPTAVVPGLRKLALVLDPAEQETEPSVGQQAALTADSAQTILSTPQAPSSSPASIASTDSRLFDQTSRKPHPEIVSHVLNVFFEHFGGHFPFLHPQILGGHVRSEEASSFLLNAIAALTVRFCSADGPLAVLGERYDIPWRRGAPFLVKAKEQLVPLLSIPAPEVVAGLLILAWAEFGDNNEAGLWMFAGMAIRMAQDLGLHRTPETEVDPDMGFHDNARPSPDGSHILTDEQSAVHQQKARLVMFWSVFILDVCVSLVTGRPPTIRRSEIEVPVPSYSDMKLAQLDLGKEVTVQNMLFPATVGLMLNFSETVELLNQMLPTKSRDPSSAVVTECSNQKAGLAQAKKALERQYSMLPKEVEFSIENFKAASSSNQSGLYLIIHLFFYTFLTLLSSNHSRESRNGLNQARSRRPSVSGTLDDAPRQQIISGPLENKFGSDATMLARQKIVQILTVAELVDNTSYLASPFTNHCLFVAASTLLRDMGQMQSIPATQGDLFSLSADADYSLLFRKLQEQAMYFGGIKSVVSVLEREHRALSGGLGQGFHASSGEESEDGMHRVAILDDPGIVNRYSIPDNQR